MDALTMNRRALRPRSVKLLAALIALATLALVVGAPFARAESSGRLTGLSPPFVGAEKGTSHVVVSPDGRSVYATNRDTTTVSQYSRSTTTGVLSPLSPATVGAGSSPEGIVISPDGTTAYVANRNSNSVSQYFRNTATGTLSPQSPATVAAGEGPIGIAISSDGRNVYAADSSSGKVSEYARSAETGKLTPLVPASVAAGTNAHGILVSPDGKNVYLTNYGDGTVGQYSRNTETGVLTALTKATVGAGANPHDLAISPNGKNVYVANSTAAGSVSQFTRNQATGALTAMSPPGVLAGEYTEAVTVSPDGNNVYATNYLSNTVSQYLRNDETGALTAPSPATVASESHPEAIVISPDGRNAYVADHGSEHVTQYSRESEPPPPPPAPTVVTRTAGGSTQTSTTVSGSVNPNGSEVSDCHFEYGTTNAYGAKAPCSPSPGSGTSAVSVSASLTNLQANTSYHFRIVATNLGGTRTGGDETFTTLPDPPTVETGTASSFTQTSATLNATVNPNGGEVGECYFEYGTEIGYGSSVPCASTPGSGHGSVAISAAVAGLTANTTYHFRIIARNAGGKSAGSDKTFKTPPNPPTAETNAASAITQTTATLNASVNPDGGEVSECNFEFGAIEGYGSSVPCSSSPGSGASPVAVSASLGGLAPNTTYHFRIVATNAGGTSKGADQSFTTPPVPPAQQVSGSSGTPAGGEVLPYRETKDPAIPDVELVGMSLTASPAGVLSVKLTCPRGESSCTGTITLQTLAAVSAATTGHRSKPRKAGILVLASGSFTLAGGQVKTLNLHLSTGGRALLARTHVLRARATIVAHDPAGATHTAQSIATLRQAKATRHH